MRWPDDVIRLVAGSEEGRLYAGEEGLARRRCPQRASGRRRAEASPGGAGSGADRGRRRRARREWHRLATAGFASELAVELDLADRRYDRRTPPQLESRRRGTTSFSSSYRSLTWAEGSITGLLPPPWSSPSSSPVRCTPGSAGSGGPGRQINRWSRQMRRRRHPLPRHRYRRRPSSHHHRDRQGR